MLQWQCPQCLGLVTVAHCPCSESPPVTETRLSQPEMYQNLGLSVTSAPGDQSDDQLLRRLEDVRQGDKRIQEDLQSLQIRLLQNQLQHAQLQQEMLLRSRKLPPPQSPSAEASSSLAPCSLSPRAVSPLDSETVLLRSRQEMSQCGWYYGKLSWQQSQALLQVSQCKISSKSKIIQIFFSVFRGRHISSQGQPWSPVHLHPLTPAGQGRRHQCPDFLLTRKVLSGRGWADPPPHAPLLQRGRPGQPLRQPGPGARLARGPLCEAECEAASAQVPALSLSLRPPRHQQKYPKLSGVGRKLVLYKIFLWHQTITHETVGVSRKVYVLHLDSILA